MTTDNPTPDNQPTPGTPADELDQPTTPDHPADDHQPAPDDQADGQADDRVKAARSDAAKYRTRLREAEAQRDEIAAKYTSLLRGTIEAEARLKHHTPGAALWDAGTDPTELLADDGSLDPTKLRNACDAARTRYGIGRPPESPGQGITSDPAPEVTWRDALRND